MSCDKKWGKKTAQHYVRKIQKYRKYNCCRLKRQQRGGFLNWYDFAYAGRDTVNQAFKNLNNTAPKLIIQKSNEVDKIAKTRIRQVINNGGQHIQKIAPQIIHVAIEDIYKTPFRLLGKFGKQKFYQLKGIFLKAIKKWSKVVLQIKFITVVLLGTQAAKGNWSTLKRVTGTCCQLMIHFGRNQQTWKCKQGA